MIDLLSEIMGLDLLKKTRKTEYVTARYSCFLWLRNNTYLSLNQIGDLFKLDHATVVYGISEMRVNLSINDDIAKKIFGKN